ncbi:hypothetical protein D3C80_1627710 [compost metagenome]
MRAPHPNGSTAKATTDTHHLLATAIVGEALIDYMVQKTPAARIRLESLAGMARRLGDLTDRDAAVVAEQLARPCSPRRPSLSLI